MKHLASFSAAALFSLGALAQSGMDHKGMDMSTKAEKKSDAGQVHAASGTVRKVDAAKNRVTIAHDPVESLKWPKMTMAFVVKDKVVLEKLAVGKKIDFQFVHQGKDYVVTSVK